jgi:hypothetical protein
MVRYPERGLFTPSDLYAAPQHMDKHGMSHELVRGVVRSIGPGLCKILYMDFRECPFCALR